MNSIEKFIKINDEMLSYLDLHLDGNRDKVILKVNEFLALRDKALKKIDKNQVQQYGDTYLETIKKQDAKIEDILKNIKKSIQLDIVKSKQDRVAHRGYQQTFNYSFDGSFIDKKK